MILRPASPADRARLFCWRNDPETRASSRNSAVIAPHEHEIWLATALADPDRRLYIAEERGEAVGTVRCDRGADGWWELSWTVAPRWRGRGFGRAMVQSAARICGDRVCAWIKPGHVASEAIARAAGMTSARLVDGFAYWKMNSGG